jgi:hypothetical protein
LAGSRFDPPHTRHFAVGPDMGNIFSVTERSRQQSPDLRPSGHLPLLREPICGSTRIEFDRDFPAVILPSRVRLRFSARTKTAWPKSFSTRSPRSTPAT